MAQISNSKSTQLKFNGVDDIEEKTDGYSKNNKHCHIKPSKPITSHVTAHKSKKNRRSILILGEADYSYSVAFIKKRYRKDLNFPTSSVIATELRSKYELQRVYKDISSNISKLIQYGVTVRYKIDATTLHKHFGDKKFSRIYFNCPHGQSMNPYSGQIGEDIIRPFFKSAAKNQPVGGKLYVSIPVPVHLNGYVKNEQQRGTQSQFLEGFGYKLYESSHQSQYKYIKKRKLDHVRYPGYKHRQTKKDKSAKIASRLRQFIFVKCAKNERINYTQNDRLLLFRSRRNKKKKKKRKNFYVLPSYDTDNDSSDYE